MTDRKQIFLSYLQGLLIIDIIAIFPFYLLNDGDSGRSNSLIRFVRISKLARIFKGSKILIVFKNMSNSKKLSNLIKIIRTYDGIARLVSAIYIIFLMAHFTACMWYYTARVEGLVPDSWVVRHGFQDSD